MHAKFAAVAAAAICLVPATALAAGFADPAAIDQAVAQFTGADIGAQGGARAPVDRRLRLTRCAEPFALEWYGASRDTVLVRCPEAGGWRIFVPLTPGASQAGGAASGPDVVTRGEVVTIAIRGGGFTLTRKGETMEAGAVGEWIRVRATDKREPLRAQVLRPGLVGMELP